MKRILYVGRDKYNPDEFCPGSVVCMALVEQIATKIEMQDCSILIQSTELPDWLNGTPIYIDDVAGEPLRGRDAIHALRQILNEERIQNAQQEDEKALNKVSAKQTRTEVKGRIDPEVTRTGALKEAEVLAKRETKHAPAQSETFADDDDAPEHDADFGPLSGDGNVPIRDDKITEADLQRFVEMRNKSPAAAKSQAPQ